MRSGDRVAEAALALVGTPFRLHGRDPQFGLDCLGLAQHALREAGLRAVAPTEYGLRNSSIARYLKALSECDLAPVKPPVMAGDLLLVRPGPAQHHLVIAGPEHTFIHAHAGLRRVVSSPGPLTWPVLRHWRPHRNN